jgi:hypothetical protein
MASQWKVATIDYDRGTTEFTGDDGTKFTDLVDLESEYEYMTVFIPALSASGIVYVYVQRDGEIDTVPVVVHVFDDDTTGSFAHATSSGAGSIVVIFRIGGCRYFRLYVSEIQTANRIFYCRGFNAIPTI